MKRYTQIARLSNTWTTRHIEIFKLKAVSTASRRRLRRSKHRLINRMCDQHDGSVTSDLIRAECTPFSPYNPKDGATKQIKGGDLRSGEEGKRSAVACVPLGSLEMVRSFYSLMGLKYRR